MFLLILEREDGEEEREKNIDQLPPVNTLTGDQIRNLGTFPDQESNLHDFSVWDGDDPPSN